MKAPYVKWYPKDILSSARVAEMDAKVECWYRRALDFCWENKSLPADPFKLAQIIGKKCTAKACTHFIIPMFSICPTDETRLIHKRQEEERGKIVTASEKNREAANARWNKRNANAYANAMPEEMQTHMHSHSVTHELGNATQKADTDTEVKKREVDTRDAQRDFLKDWPELDEKGAWVAKTLNQLTAGKFPREMMIDEARRILKKQPEAPYSFITGWANTLIRAEEQRQQADASGLVTKHTLTDQQRKALEERTAKLEA
jgi:hypothetical protein